MSKKVFLEAHNLKNLTTGFGVFNYELLKAMTNENLSDLEVKVLVKNVTALQKCFGDKFVYKKYYSLMRNKPFRIRTKCDVFHSLNQNTKIEPFYKPNTYILTIHDVNFADTSCPDFNGKRLKMFQEKLDRADYLTFISNYAKEQTASFFDIKDIPNKIIFNGNSISEIYDLGNFQPKHNPVKPYFFSIGVFMDKKNFHSLVEMMRLLPDYQLLLAGSDQNDYGNKIRELIEKFQLQDRVKLLGRISEEEKQFYMKNCIAFLFPSIGEGFGLPPLEAMTFGKPVFMSNYTSLPEIGGEEAYYWKHFDSEYMKEILLNGLNDYENNREVKSKQIIKRSQLFTWDNAAKEYLELYRTI